MPACLSQVLDKVKEESMTRKEGGLVMLVILVCLSW
jgi:hypothetical protein